MILFFIVRAYNLWHREEEDGLGASDTCWRQNHLAPGTQDDLSNKVAPNEEEGRNESSPTASVV